MKLSKQSLCWLAPVALVVAGCASGPTRPDPTISEWERNGMLPWVAEWQPGDAAQPASRPLSLTGRETTRVYSTYPSSDRTVIVEADQSYPNPADLALADAIRYQVEYDRGLAPSLQRVVIEVRDGQVTLRGAVKSDLDARVVVDSVRDIAGVSHVNNNLEISSTLD